MAQSIQEFSARLESRFATELLSCTVANGEVTVEVTAGSLTALARALRDEPEFDFTQLVDVCGVDYSTYGQADWKTDAATDSGFSRGVDRGGEVATTTSKSRFAVVYHLLSIEHNQRLRVRAFPDGDPPTIDSVVDLWASANWFERETFDLFGILFDGHPDLRRILTDYGFIGHPFRKDFPLEGNVEVRYDPSKGRVVYQPVTIENRVLVPRVIRNESSGPEPAASEDPGNA